MNYKKYEKIKEKKEQKRLEKENEYITVRMKEDLNVVSILRNLFCDRAYSEILEEMGKREVFVKDNGWLIFQMRYYKVVFNEKTNDLIEQIYRSFKQQKEINKYNLNFYGIDIHDLNLYEYMFVDEVKKTIIPCMINFSENENEFHIPANRLGADRDNNEIITIQTNTIPKNLIKEYKVKKNNKKKSIEEITQVMDERGVEISFNKDIDKYDDPFFKMTWYERFTKEENSKISHKIMSRLISHTASEEEFKKAVMVEGKIDENLITPYIDEIIEKFMKDINERELNECWYCKCELNNEGGERIMCWNCWDDFRLRERMGRDKHFEVVRKLNESKELGGCMIFSQKVLDIANLFLTPKENKGIRSMWKERNNEQELEKVNE